jgi:hypothetical protein
MVEAAIIAPFLLLMTFSIVDFATMFYVHLTIESAVSQATRYAVTGRTLQDAGGQELNRAGTIMAAARRAAPTVTIPDSAFSFSHMTPGSASWSGGTGGPGDIERVGITLTWSFFTPTVRAFFTNGQVTLRAESIMKNEGRFQ